MILDLKKYNLVRKNENRELFKLQESIIGMNSINEIDKVIKISLLIIQPPISDYETAVKILYDFSKCRLNKRILILGADINNYWPYYNPNTFIVNLKNNLNQYSTKEKSIIKYLEAVNIDNNIVNKTRNHYSKLIQLLKESIELDSKSVNNYYRLAILSKKSEAKKLMEIALTNVESVYKDTTYEELIVYDNYLNDFITGTKMYIEHYNILKEFYETLL